MCLLCLPRPVHPFTYQIIYRFKVAYVFLGSRHAYSNFGYLVLGLVIERVTGQSYEECILSLLKEIGVEDISIGFTKKIPSHYMEVSICQKLNWCHIL